MLYLFSEFDDPSNAYYRIFDLIKPPSKFEVASREGIRSLPKRARSVTPLSLPTPPNLSPLPSTPNKAHNFSFDI